MQQTNTSPTPTTHLRIAAVAVAGAGAAVLQKVQLHSLASVSINVESANPVGTRQLLGCRRRVVIKPRVHVRAALVAAVDTRHRHDGRTRISNHSELLRGINAAE